MNVERDIIRLSKDFFAKSKTLGIILSSVSSRTIDEVSVCLALQTIDALWP